MSWVDFTRKGLCDTPHTCTRHTHAHARTPRPGARRTVDVQTLLQCVCGCSGAGYYFPHTSVAAQKLETNVHIPSFLQKNVRANGYDPAVSQAAQAAWMTH